MRHTETHTALVGDPSFHIGPKIAMPLIPQGNTLSSEARYEKFKTYVFQLYYGLSEVPCHLR